MLGLLYVRYRTGPEMCFGTVSWLEVSDDNLRVKFTSHPWVIGLCNVVSCRVAPREEGGSAVDTALKT